ncbi:hypothetical protein [Euzebya sp.]|uniref:hypothetical protein n=1 Tax=Euzebya sp. TaxID=1971409 RepID=UPI00351812A8
METSVELAVGTRRLTVDVAHGPRVVSLLDLDGQELMASLDPPVAVGPTTGPQAHLRGGHRLWPAPEVPAVTYACDDAVGRVVRTGRGAVAVDDGTPVRRRLEVATDGDVVRLEHTITNTGSDPLPVAPWALTQLRPGGVVHLPVGDTPADEHGLQASGAILTWPYTRLADPRIALTDGVVVIDATGMAPDAPPIKLGVDGSIPWAAYVVGDTVLIVHGPTRSPTAAYVDLGATVQSYACGRFVELEVLGPLVVLEPGESTALPVRWTVHPRPPGTGADLAAALPRLAALADAT